MLSESDRMRALCVPPEIVAAGKFRFLASCDLTVLNDIDCGLVFVMAFWSGPSRQAFQQVKSLLRKVDSECRLELVVVDADGCPNLYEHPLFRGAMSGAGETAWVKGGVIRAVTVFGFSKAAFIENTNELLRETA
jgi:hypothetical protein